MSLQRKLRNSHPSLSKPQLILTETPTFVLFPQCVIWQTVQRRNCTVRRNQLKKKTDLKKAVKKVILKTHQDEFDCQMPKKSSSLFLPQPSWKFQIDLLFDKNKNEKNARRTRDLDVKKVQFDLANKPGILHQWRIWRLGKSPKAESPSVAFFFFLWVLRSGWRCEF